MLRRGCNERKQCEKDNNVNPETRGEELNVITRDLNTWPAEMWGINHAQFYILRKPHFGKYLGS